MSARFQVHRALVLPERSLFVLAGVVEEGMVNTGMRVVRDDDAPFDATVHTVEFASGDEEGAPEPALTFHYSTDEKLARWRELTWEGQRLLLEW